MTEQEQPILKVRPHQPHSSYRVWHILVNQSGEKVLPRLLNPKKEGAYVLVALILLAVFGGASTGLMVYEQINPPLQVIGVCLPPAQLVQISGFFGFGAHVECLKSVTTYQIVDGRNTTLTAQQPAGEFFYTNGTRASP